MASPPYTTATPNAQVPMDPEKGDTATLLPAAHPGYNSTVYLHGQPVSMMPAQDPQSQRSRDGRFCARLIHWIVLDTVFCLIILFTFKDFHKISNAFRNAFYGSNPVATTDPGDHEVHLPFDCTEVAQWDHVDAQNYHNGYEHAVRTSVDLPVSSDLLYFVSHGFLSNGIVKFVDSGAKDSLNATVDVKFFYDYVHDHDHDLPDLLKVCRLQRARGKNGVGIFSPDWSRRPGRHHSTVEILVQLPLSASIFALDTSLPLFVHDIGDFRDSVTFGTVSLKTSNVPIVVKYLTANKISAETSNSHISGTFNSTDRIDIITSNSFIEGEFYLSNDVAHSSYPSHANLHTSNGPVKAQFYLTSTAEDHQQGKFNVDTRTSNSPLNVKFNDAPVDSQVTFTGKTSNSPIAATLHETFEGKFLVTTGRWFEAGVHVSDKEDPSGQGRQRRVTRNGSSRGYAEGKVVWGDADGLGSSYAELTTSNSPAHLYL